MTSTPILRGEAPLPYPDKSNELSWKGLLRALPLGIAIIAALAAILIAIFFALEPGSLLFRLFTGPVGKSFDRLRPAPSGDNPFVFIALLPLAICVGILIHELGHVIAGLLVRYPFIYVMVGPIRLTRTKNRFKLSLHKQLDGLALHLPKGSRRSWKTAIFALGGPIANAVTFTFAWAPIRLPVDSTFRGLVCLISLVLFLSNLVPFHTNGFASDGMLIWQALISPRHRIRDTAVACLAREFGTKRARQLHSTWIKKALQSSGPTTKTFVAHWIAYWHFNDLQDWDRAANALNLCLGLTHIVNPGVRHLCILEAAVFHAWALDDLAGAQKWKAQVPDTAIEAPRLLRWHIVEATARRDQAALQLWEKGTEMIAANKNEAQRTYLSEAWTEMRPEIEKRLQLAPGKARAASASA